MRWMFFGFSDFQENNVWHRSIVHNITFVFLNSGSVKSNQSILNHCLLLHAIRKTVLFGYPWKALQSLVCFKAEGGESGGRLHRLFLDTRNGPTTVESVSGFVWFSAHLVSFRERERVDQPVRMQNSNMNQCLTWSLTPCEPNGIYALLLQANGSKERISNLPDVVAESAAWLQAWDVQSRW